MKRKIISIILIVVLLVPNFASYALDNNTIVESTITKDDAYQFAKDLSEMNMDEDDTSSRLIVSANKNINYMGAVDVATGIEGLYVLQFPDSQSANKAYNYYNSLSYVNYVEFDAEIEDALCSTDTDNIVLQNTRSEFDFVPDCPSTVNQNIDDAIKLLKQENIEMPKIRIGIIDSGIAKTKITQSRLDGGYSYLDNHSSDGTQDNQGHGTKVAGTIIQNTPDYVKLYSYQIFNIGNRQSLTTAISAIYLAITDNCKIINCSFLFNEAKKSNAMIDAVNYAESQGIIIICAAGNETKELETYDYPAILENTITVGATTPANRLATFSNFGDGIDIYAVGNLMTSYDTSGNKVTNWGGTSGAAPVISSICALLVTAKPDIAVDEIKQLLLETGYSTNEENQTDDTRIIADAYGCVKKLLGSELEPLRLD